MKAAVVHSFGAAPAFADYPDPEAGEGETIITVSAAPLSPIVKALAAGTHYASGNEAGFVAGVDGVGTDPSGRTVYFLFPKRPFGSMAQKALVPAAMTVPVPDGLAHDRAAAIATGGLASWIALTRRARLQKGESVLVLGATGAAGGMAISVARHLGANRIIAVGRSEKRLGLLDADVKIGLDPDADDALRREFDAGVDVVLDFVWGDPASRVQAAAAGRRGSPLGEPRLRYVQLGTMAGDTVPLRGYYLRSSGLELMGSGIGSVTVRELITGAGELLAAAPAAGFAPRFASVPLHDVAEAWSTASEVRTVICPRSV